MEHRLQSMEEAGIVLREQMALLREAHVAERKHDQQLHARRNRKRLEKREREASEQRQRNKEWRMLIENMVRLQSSFAATYKDISSALESCKYRSISGPVLGPHSAKLKELGNCMEQLVARATVRKTRTIFNYCTIFYTVINDIVNSLHSSMGNWLALTLPRRKI